MPDPIRILLFGAGNRGEGAYGQYALQHPDEIQFVAVADPNPKKRTRSHVSVNSRGGAKPCLPGRSRMQSSTPLRIRYTMNQLWLPSMQAMTCSSKNRSLPR